MHERAPNEGHSRLLRELCGICQRYEGEGIRDIEVIAILGQVIGHKISDMSPSAGYSVQDVLQSVAANIEAGNRQAGETVAPMAGHS